VAGSNEVRQKKIGLTVWSFELET